MSAEGEAWEALPVEERRYGGPGLPGWCVAHVDCPQCGATPGQLCRGSLGLNLRHHWLRGTAYQEAKRRGTVPRHPCETTQLRSRIADLEALLERAEAALQDHAPVHSGALKR